MGTVSAFLIWNSITFSVFCEHYNPFKMASTTGVNSFNKSKEDFIWFIKKATSDRKTDAHSELYHALLKMFVDADTNYDGLVSRDSFSILIDKAASIPRAYGYAPPDSELYKTEDSLDVREDTTLGNGDSSQQLVQLLIVTDGQLQVPGDDPGLLVVTGSIACQFKDLSC